MKVLFCSTSYSAYDRRMIRIIHALSHEGEFEIDWISRHHNQADYSLSKRYYIKTFFKSGALFYAEFNLRLLLKLMKFKPDVISSVDLDTLLACTIASKIKGAKLIFDAHEYFSEVPELNGRPFIKKVWRLIGRMCMSSTDQRYSVGPILAQELTKLYQHPFDVIRNVPPIKKLSLANNDDTEKSEKVIGYLGVLNKGRGLEEMIKALKELPKNYTLLLVGHGDITQKLKDLTVQLGLENRVTFTGMVDPSEIEKTMSNVWCGVQILDRQSESYYLSLGNKTFDYINLEIPAILSDFPEYRNLNTEHPTATLIRDLAVKSIIQGISKLSDDKYYKLLKANCKVMKSKHNWELESKKLLTIYKSIF